MTAAPPTATTIISDTGGSCPAAAAHVPAVRTGGAAAPQWSSPPPLPPAEAQARTCKYEGASIGSAQGPNYLCDSKPILPLTTDKASVQTMIQGLIAKGGTNILEGLMWGWRVLSPEAPFTEGREYTDAENTKYLVLMTDGENWHQAMSNHNKSSYHSFGYAVKGRLGTTYTNTALVNQMNTKTLAACANAKAAGIKVYTVAFRLERRRHAGDAGELRLGRDLCLQGEQRRGAGAGVRIDCARDCQAAHRRLTQRARIATRSARTCAQQSAGSPSLPAPARLGAIRQLTPHRWQAVGALGRSGTRAGER